MSNLNENIQAYSIFQYKNKMWLNQCRNIGAYKVLSYRCINSNPLLFCHTVEYCTHTVEMTISLIVFYIWQ